MDLLPTFLDFIDQKPSGLNVDGISIKDHLLHQVNLPKRDVFHAFKKNSFIRSGNWKLISIYNNKKNRYKTELYDLSEDLQEKKDVSSVHPKLVSDLTEKLELWKIEVKKGVNMLSE